MQDHMPVTIMPKSQPEVEFRDKTYVAHKNRDVRSTVNRRVLSS